MEAFCIFLMVVLIMSTVFEMYALYTEYWKFPFWRIGIMRNQFSSVFLMSFFACVIGLTFDWISAILSLLAYIVVYIALYFYITDKAPRTIYPTKIGGFHIILGAIAPVVLIFGIVIENPYGNIWRMIIFFLLNMFFLFLPLYYLFEVREQKLEEKRQQDEERRRQEEEKRYQEEEERRKKKEKEEEWIIVTDEINGKTEEEQ